MQRTYSIITVTWNNANGLARTLASVRRLDYSNYQLIVIDGASADGTRQVLDENKDIISVAISEKDNGIYDAMNKGLQYAEGDYVVFMNAGDAFAAANTLSTVNGYEGDILLGGTIYGNDKRHVKPVMSLYDVLSIGINHQSTYYRADIIKHYGFDLNYPVIADLKSVVEPMAKDKIKVTAIEKILSVCEGGGLSKQRWKDMLTEKKNIINEVIDPYYRSDYARFSRINNAMADDFILLSHFSSVFPLLRMLSKIVRFLNDKFKHIPI